MNDVPVPGKYANGKFYWPDGYEEMVIEKNTNMVGPPESSTGDSDLDSCLEFNPQKDFTASDVEAVLAVVEGENEGGDWHWILRLTSAKKKRYAYVTGWCGYSGWDCESSASSHVTNSVTRALEWSPVNSQIREILYLQLKSNKVKTTKAQKQREAVPEMDSLPVVELVRPKRAVKPVDP